LAASETFTSLKHCVTHYTQYTGSAHTFQKCADNICCHPQLIPSVFL